MKLKVGISACLLGQNVRYDGANKHQPGLIKRLSRDVVLIPICPEAEAGLGIPRPPVQLTQELDGIHAIGVEDAALDVTDSLNQWMDTIYQRLSEMRGFVLKARSPSCGIRTTPILAGGVVVDPNGSGLFAAYLQREFPGSPLVDEEQLQDEKALQQFIASLH
ncbi:MAG: DUF523 domain-containing protein [bacterium]